MRLTYIQTVFLVSRDLFFCCGTEIDSNFSCLAVSWVARGLFHFVFIVLKPLKKAQNISLLLHGNDSVLLLLLLLLFFFPKEAWEMFSATTLTATRHAERFEIAARPLKSK